MLYNWLIALGLDKGTNATFIGVVVAVCGNVLISFALNCQKLAHRRIEAAYNAQHGLDDDDQEPGESPVLGYRAIATSPVNIAPLPSRSQSLPIPPPSRSSALGRQVIPLVVGPSPAGSYDSRPSIGPRAGTQSSLRAHSPIAEARENSSSDSTSHAEAAILDDLESGARSPQRGPNESAYLHSKLWWTGFALMNIGEFGNFLSYAYAPASLVAPLGAVALIANCLFAPLMLHERFRTQDLWGMGLCILGAFTVVYSSHSSSARLDPDTLIHALTRIPFIVWAAVNVAGMIFLSGLSSQRTMLENSGWMQGDRWALVDVGLCALFGGFTVLSTKAVSSLMSTEWGGVFTEWIFYVSILILGLTGLGQIRHLNRALHYHESRVVIPTQFVLFNLTAIIGSAILYRDFDKIEIHRFFTFFYGCLTTFLGVYLLTIPSTPPTPTVTPRPSRMSTQTTPLLPKSKSKPSTWSAAVSAKHRGVVHKGSAASLNVVGLSPGPYLLLATPAGSPGVVPVPVRDGTERERVRGREHGRPGTRSHSRSTVRGGAR
ncbi:NIPA-like protein 2 [Ceratobasidium theobromae]|uniref:NIPA-like protein 2 n=1 Tax=Ceratobasidium theobromae TaxID=1582974 RepID=A0A5N5QWX7_9AGAM|nr:NIPA-like protein 2 [Ceratobasidium theobromae]